MEISVWTISKQTIKPSSLTPDRLRSYELSFPDQISSPVYNPLISSTHSPRMIISARTIYMTGSRALCLSDTLSHFYVLAGRLKDNEWVECNDVGVPWIETVVNLRLHQVTDYPVPKELNKLGPFVLDVADNVLLGVQLNRFNCRGIVLGLCVAHKVAGGLSVFTFVRFWMAISRGQPSLAFPDLVSAELFPPRNLRGLKPRVGITTDNMVSKPFVFQGDKIEALKSKFSSNLLMIRPPSRVEALSAFLWSRYVSSIEVHSKPEGETRFVLQAVNLRMKFDPPLPEHSCGNYYRPALGCFQELHSSASTSPQPASQSQY